jgi:CRISPR-associated protein Csb2
MLALRVTYLMGRVYSAAFDDGDTKAEPEWPPHPSRLFSALTAAWGEGGAEDRLRGALEWLERQGAPRVLAGEHTARSLVQAFVPVNDSETLPDDRPRKPRVFPSGTLSHPDVYFVWDATPDSEVETALDQIVQRTSSLGHSSSLVSIELARSLARTEGLTELQPDAEEGDRMRIPYPGRLLELIERHRRFEQTGSKIYRPSAGKSTLYAPKLQATSKLIRGIFDRMIVLQREVGPRASLRSALSVMTALRGAIQKKGPQPPPECLSGHSPESTPERPVRSERPHIAVVPLPFVGFPHSTGELLGAAVLLPVTLTREERDICWRAASEVEELAMPWGAWRVSLTDAEETRRALQPRTWTSPHYVWSTVTPFVFDRYPQDPYGEEAEGVVRAAMVRVGLPEPSEIDLHYNPWHLGVPKASAFAAAPARPGKPRRYHCHVRVRFEERVAGPLIAGAGRYYGYGLFRALFDGEGVK